MLLTLGINLWPQCEVIDHQATFYTNLFARQWLTVKGTGFSFQSYMPKCWRKKPWSPHPRTRKTYLHIWAFKSKQRLSICKNWHTEEIWREERQCKKALTSRVVVNGRWASHTVVTLAIVQMWFSDSYETQREPSSASCLIMPLSKYPGLESNCCQGDVLPREYADLLHPQGQSQ